jgi:flagellar biogenesis protein FliO
MMRGMLGVALVVWLLGAWSPDLCAELASGAGGIAPDQGTPSPTGQALNLPAYREPQSPVPGGAITSQIFTALGVVLGLLSLGAYLYKRAALRGRPGSRSNETIRILTRAYLSQKESLCLVQVGSHILLLGQTGSAITLLHRLDQPPHDLSEGRAVAGSGSHWRGQAEDRLTAGQEPSSSPDLAGLKSRLQRLHMTWGIGA